jgi:hypothetical protein
MVASGRGKIIILRSIMKTMTHLRVATHTSGTICLLHFVHFPFLLTLLPARWNQRFSFLNIFGTVGTVSKILTYCILIEQKRDYLLKYRQKVQFFIMLELQCGSTALHHKKQKNQMNSRNLRHDLRTPRVRVHQTEKHCSSTQ